MTYDDAYFYLCAHTHRIPKRPPDEDIAPVWSKMVDFEKRWYLAFLQAVKYHNDKMTRALAVLAGLDPEEFVKRVKNEKYLKNQELINLTMTKYWDYITDHSTRWAERKARRKRKPERKDPDTCQRELDWDAGYWFSGGVVDVYEMQGKRRSDDKDYTQQPAWWPK